MNAARALESMGLVTGDRIVMILPTTLEGIYVIEACKRLGIIYACVPSSLPAQSLADRVEDTGAKILVVSGQAGLALGNQVLTDFYRAADLLIWINDLKLNELQVHRFKAALAGHITVSSDYLRSLWQQIAPDQASHVLDERLARCKVGT